jgi:hypothetical protein
MIVWTDKDFIWMNVVPWMNRFRSDYIFIFIHPGGGGQSFGHMLQIYSKIAFGQKEASS